MESFKGSLCITPFCMTDIPPSNVISSVDVCLGFHEVGSEWLFSPFLFCVSVLYLKFSYVPWGQKIREQIAKIKCSSDTMAKTNSPDLCCDYIRLGKLFYVPGPKLVGTFFQIYLMQQGFNIHKGEALEGC